MSLFCSFKHHTVKKKNNNKKADIAERIKDFECSHFLQPVEAQMHPDGTREDSLA